MSTSSFVPEIWAAELLTALANAHVFASPAVVNSDYEGDVQRGASVKVNTLSDITVNDYTGTVSAEALTTSAQTMSINFAKYFALKVDSVERVQAAGDLLSAAAQRAAYGLAQATDEYIAGTILADAGTDLGTVTVASGGDAFDLLRSMVVALDEANCPRAGRFVIVNPEVHGYLISDDRFARADASGQAAAAITGVVGQALGLNVLVSNNCGSAAVAGHPIATTWAQQLVETEAYRAQDAFADVVRGLLVGGAAVIRPEALVKAND